MAMPDLSALRDAAQRLVGKVTRTPLVHAPWAGDVAPGGLWLKLETAQATGAFKLRGATNAVACLPADARAVVCCSTGNHGRAVAHAAAARRLEATVCLSSLVPEAKRRAIAATGARLKITGDSQDAAGVVAKEMAQADGVYEIPPFDHPHVIAGQGTIGLELAWDMPDAEAVLIPLSGGGLAAGISVALRALCPRMRVIGVSMENGAAMAASLKAGHPVDMVEVPTLADSLGGGIGLDNSYTFALCRDLLDEVVQVDEAAIYAAMRRLYWDGRLITEGAAAVGLAALATGRVSARGKIISLITGSNVDMAQFTATVTGKEVKIGDHWIGGTHHGE